MLADVIDEPRLLLEVDRGALVVVVADVADEPHGGLRQGQQPLLLRGDRHPGAGVRVDDRADIWPRRMDRAVDYVPGAVVRVVRIRLPDDLAVLVDLHEG